MKAGVPWFVGLAVLLVGAGLTASPALAKCHKACKTQIRNEFKACRAMKTGSLAVCKAATNPMPPDCGQTIPSTTTTATTSTTTTTTTTTASTTTTTMAATCS